VSIEKSCVRFLILLTLLAVGCSRPNRVAGTVSLDGQPLPAGRVTFLCDGEGRPAISGKIDANGSYEIENPPVGRARVSVETFKPEPKPEPGVNPQTGIDYSLGWEDTGPYVPIPARYGSVKTSGLETMIEPRHQTFDISLTGK
jgi:hypothetical protein